MLIELAVRTATGRGGTSELVTRGDPGAGTPPGLILVIDQLEELFAAGEDADWGRAEREAFIAALHTASYVSWPGLDFFPAALVIAAVRAI